MYAKAVLIAIVIRTPDGITEGIIGHDMPAVFCQLAQQGQLGSRQRQCFSVGQADNGIVQLYTARPQLQGRWFSRRQFRAVSPLQDMLYPQQQLLHQKGLCQVIVRPQPQPEQPVCIRIPC